VAFSVVLPGSGRACEESLERQPDQDGRWEATEVDHQGAPGDLLGRAGLLHSARLAADRAFERTLAEHRLYHTTGLL
jgi:hypothetical protein